MTTLQLSERTVALGVCAVFGTVTMVTRHPHWTKTPEQVRPISEPLTELLNTLPAEVVERLEKYGVWMILAQGIAQVAGKDVMIEMEIRKLEKQGWTPPASPISAQPTATPAAPSSPPAAATAPLPPEDL